MNIEMKEKEPLVSVLMNCYNGERYLREAIESVLSQTYQNWELVFWDNQSTDKSADIFKSYQDSRLKYHYAPTHTDLGGGRANAWPYLKGEFIAFLDTDDLWLPEKLTKQIPLFDSADVGIVISDTLFFNQKKERQLYGKNLPPQGNVFRNLLSKYFISLETMVIRKEVIENLKRAFDPDFSFIADFDLAVRASETSELAIVPEVLAKWRVHDESDTWKSPSAFFEEKERWINKQLLENPSWGRDYQQEIKQLNKSTLINKAAVQIANSDRLSAFKSLFKIKFKHKYALMLLAFCITPFSEHLLNYLYKKRSGL